MESRRLGQSGLMVSEIGIGCNQLGNRVDAQGTKSIVDRAIDMGITFFDTGDVYAKGLSETYLGKALGSRRGDVIIATKFGSPMGASPLERGGSRRYVLHAVEESLRRLGTDYIDLYQYHEVDPLTPFEETFGALDDLVHQGKVRYLGTTKMQAWQLAEIQWTTRTRGLTSPVCAEHQYHLLNRTLQDEVIPACRALGLGLLPFFPLASGMLTGKYRPGSTPEDSRLAQHKGLAEQFLTDRNYSTVERLTGFATEHNHTVLELAFAWLLSQPEISSVIAGVTSPDQVTQNALAATWRLTAEERAGVEGVLASV